MARQAHRIELKLIGRKMYFLFINREEINYGRMFPSNVISERADRRREQSHTVNSHQDGGLALHLVVCHSVTDVAGNG